MDFSSGCSFEDAATEAPPDQKDTFDLDPSGDIFIQDSAVDVLQDEANKFAAEEMFFDENTQDKEHYDLRANTLMNNRSFPGTWIDHDETGDYDPVEEARRLRARKKRPLPMNPLDRNQTDGDNSIRAESEVPDHTEPREPEPLMVSLKFASTAARKAFTDQCTQLLLKPEETRDEFTEGYKLRKRKTNHDTEPWTITGVRELSPSLPENLAGHPNARGCFDCLAMGRRCSLLNNEHAWPCDDCKLEDNDCLLVTPPEKKTTCSHCKHLQKKKRWLVCSYNHEKDHSGRCKRCVEDDHFPCIAGPAPGSVPTRIRIGDDGQPALIEAPLPPQATEIPTCVQCQSAQRICSFATGSTDDVCIACEMDKEACKPLFLKQDGIKRHRDLSYTAMPASKKRRVTVKKRVSRMTSHDHHGEATAVPASASSDPVLSISPTLPTTSSSKRDRESPSPVSPAIKSRKKIVSKPSAQTASHGDQVEAAASAPPALDSSDPDLSTLPTLPTIKARTQDRDNSGSVSPTIKNRKETVNKPAAQMATHNHEGEAAATPSPDSSNPDASNISTNTSLPTTADPSATTATSTTTASQGTIITVRTHFSHPILFGHSPTTDEPCHFCGFPAQFPILGLDPVTVTVIDPPDGSGWTELSGGYRDSWGPTRMCSPCMWTRTTIIQCPDAHTLRPIAGVNQECVEEELQIALTKLTEPEMMQVEELWCSLCCNLAMQECCTPQLMRVEGCGLRVCGFCARELEGCGGKLKDMLEGVKDEEKTTLERLMGFRADFGLLKEDGLLVRHCLDAFPPPDGSGGGD